MVPPAANRSRKPRDAERRRGRVRAHDPFELIRWLALSQPDPLKALAELVQNCLDANATQIRVMRVKERGVVCLRIHDNGGGVIPEMERQDALEYIATHIGHSRKRSLSPEQRLALMTQGQYGIGLLGFWSLGEVLEIRTMVPGQKPFRLVLHRNQPHYEIEPLRGRLALDERWTEVVIVGVQRAAMNSLAGRRAADYLGSELRGQLLARDVTLAIEDKLARGRAQKLFTVRPPRFLGERLGGLGHVDVPGHPPARLEIYLAQPEEGETPQPGLGVYSAGTLVAQSFHELGALGLDHEPWTDPRLCGMVDFPAFRVAPGSRRGVLADEASQAFAAALAAVEPILHGILAQIERQKAAELDRNLIRDLQRAFRDFYRRRPRYELLPVHEKSDPGAATSGNGHGALTGDASDGVATSDVTVTTDAAPPVQPAAQLLPPGPLAKVFIRPARLRIACGTTRTVRAYATDAADRILEGGVVYEWSVQGSIGVLLEDQNDVAGRIRLQAAEDECEGGLCVTARCGLAEAVAEAPVEVLHDVGSARADEGIPKPELVSHAGAPWRSRMADGQWQVNTAHPEYRAIEERPALKLRYLAMLFAKEVVLRSHQDPRLEEALEQVVEIAAYADRNLATKRGTRPSSAADRSTD
jgi:hypothetical protein